MHRGYARAIVRLLGDNDDPTNPRYRALTPQERDALYDVVFGDGFSARRHAANWRECRHCRAWVHQELAHV